MKKPKKKIEIIFYLIQRMSRTEKRHFKLHNQLYKGKHKDFIKLFDFLNALDNYDAKKINDFFVKQKVPQKNICISYLLTKIIDSLYDEILYLTSPGKEIIAVPMRAYRAYFKMELIELAWEELIKAERLANEYNMYGELYQIHQIQREISSVMNLNKDIAISRVQTSLKQIALVEKMRIREDLAYISSIFMTHPFDSSEFKDAHTRLLSHNYDDLSTEDKKIFNNIYYWYFSSTQNQKEAVKCTLRLLELYHEDGHPMISATQGYLIIWNNLLMSSLQCSDMAASQSYYEEYKLLSQKHKPLFDSLPDALIANYHLNGCLYEISCVIITKEYENIAYIDEKTITTLNKFPTSRSRSIAVIALLLRLAFGFILIRDFNRVEFWVNKLFDLPELSRSNLVEEAEILKLVLYYETEAFTLLQSHIRSLKRKWGENPPKSKNVLFLLELSHQIHLKQNRKKLPQIWKTAHNKILKIEAETTPKVLFSRWIEQKL